MGPINTAASLTRRSSIRNLMVYSSILLHFTAVNIYIGSKDIRNNRSTAGQWGTVDDRACNPLPYHSSAKQSTGWFKHITPRIVSDECRMQYKQVETRGFCIMLTAMESGRGWRSQSIFWKGPRTGASAENVSRPITGLQSGKKWPGVYAEGPKKNKTLRSKRYDTWGQDQPCQPNMDWTSDGLQPVTGSLL